MVEHLYKTLLTMDDARTNIIGRIYLPTSLQPETHQHHQQLDPEQEGDLQM